MEKNWKSKKKYEKFVLIIDLCIWVCKKIYIWKENFVKLQKFLYTAVSSVTYAYKSRLLWK